MPKFAIIKDEAIRGSFQNFYKLYIDGLCLIDEFADSLTPQYKKHLNRAYKTMNILANGGLPSGAKWHKIDEYDGLQEAKHESIRVYFYHLKYTGKIIVLGSFQKTKQEDDIPAAIRIIKSLPSELTILKNEQELEKYLSQFNTDFNGT